MYARSLFLACGLLYALSASLGEVKFRQSRLAFDTGQIASSFVKGIQSRAIYPFQFFTRDIAATIITIANDIPAEVALDIVDGSLVNDPWSPHLLWLKTLHEMRRGNMDAGLETLVKLEKVAQDWSHAKNAREIYETLIRMRAELAAKGEPAGGR